MEAKTIVKRGRPMDGKTIEIRVILGYDLLVKIEFSYKASLKTLSLDSRRIANFDKIAIVDWLTNRVDLSNDTTTNISLVEHKLEEFTKKMKHIEHSLQVRYYGFIPRKYLWLSHRSNLFINTNVMTDVIYELLRDEKRDLQDKLSYVNYRLHNIRRSNKRTIETYCISQIVYTKHLETLENLLSKIEKKA